MTLFILGLFVGAAVGMFATALCVSASRGNKNDIQ
jgi:gas vesicle protein